MGSATGLVREALTGMPRAVLAAALLALAAPIAATDGQTPAATPALALDHRRIDAALDAMVRDRRIAGGSVLVWRKGKESHFHAAGFADREAGRSFARNTLVQAFSMTKPVTGVALMQLWDRGKFRLDDPLAKYLPQFGRVQVLAGEDAAGNPITRPPARPILIRDVLRHTAGFTYGAGGIPQNAADREWERLQPLSPDNTLAQFADKLAQVLLLHDPGERWHYSAAVDVQARLVEVLSGEAYADYVRAHIFAPLGMNDSGWRRTDADLPRLARIYAAAGGTLSPMPRDKWLEPNFMGKPMTMGGSGLVTTVDDYMRFARMLLGRGTLDEVRILKPSTVRLMATDQLDPRITERLWLPGKGSGGFGFNFFVRTAQPRTVDENRGALGEFFWDGLPSMLFWVDPANDMAVVFATQKTPFDGTLHHDIRDAVYGAAYLGPPGD